MKSTYLILGASSDTCISYLEHIDKKGESCHIIAFCHSSPERLENLGLENITIQTVIFTD